MARRGSAHSSGAKGDAPAAGELESSAPLGEAVVQIDRSGAVMLSGQDASKFMGQLSSAAKTGHRIRSGLVVGDVFELVPSSELRKGLKDGTLRAAKSKNGDASVLIRHVKSGRIAGQARLQRVDVPLKAIGGAGLSAISFAVEQKQLAEIAKRLDQIELTADETRKLLLDERAAAARGARRVAGEVRSAYEKSGHVPPALFMELLAARAQVEKALDQSLETVERHLQEYEDDKLKDKRAESYFREDFVALADGVDGLAQANAALVSIPYANERELVDAQESATRKLESASGAVVKALMDCLQLSGTRGDAASSRTDLGEAAGAGCPRGCTGRCGRHPRGSGPCRR